MKFQFIVFIFKKKFKRQIYKTGQISIRAQFHKSADARKKIMHMIYRQGAY